MLDRPPRVPHERFVADPPALPVPAPGDSSPATAAPAVTDDPIVVASGPLRARIGLDPWHLGFHNGPGRPLTEQDRGHVDISGRCRTLPLVGSTVEGTAASHGRSSWPPTSAPSDAAHASPPSSCAGGASAWGTSTPSAPSPTAPARTCRRTCPAAAADRRSTPAAPPTTTVPDGPFSPVTPVRWGGLGRRTVLTDVDGDTVVTAVREGDTLRVTVDGPASVTGAESVPVPGLTPPEHVGLHR